MNLTSLFLSLPIILIAVSAFAQTPVPFDDQHWDVDGEKHEWVQYQGQDALMVQNASATLKGVDFQDGILEWDMAFAERRGFTGINFRIIDKLNSENFYLRPHQSGQPDANQYTPKDNGLSSWQLFTGEGYASTIAYKFDQWFHVKMVITGQQAEVYIDNATTPSLAIPWLHHTATAGKLQLYANILPAYFANFTYQHQSPATTTISETSATLADPLIVRDWEISTPFAESQLTGLTELNLLSTDQLEWKSLKAPVNGTVNLAIHAPFKRDSANTVFVKLLVNSSKAQRKGLQLGFSDRARVYCNGQLLFAANDTYRTRDFRFLGTIGFHDTVFLPLQAGKNEVWIAVSENFGGWGVQARWLEE